MSLEEQEVIDIGRQFPCSSAFPPLKMGTTLDFFRVSGKNPLIKHKFIIFDKVPLIDLAHNLYNFGDNLSGPSQFDDEKELIT